MWKKITRLFIGFICGYLFIKWFPVVIPFEASNLIVEFVLNPFEFFAATLVFIIGFLVNAGLIKEGTELTALLVRQKEISRIELFLTSVVFISFLILFFEGFWQTTVFFFFSVTYGIISLDFQKIKFASD